MERPTSIPQHIWDSFSDEARALAGAVVVGLEHQVQELKARLDQNSSNRSKPPSTDPIGMKRRPPAPPSRPPHRSSLSPQRLKPFERVVNGYRA